MGAAASFFSNKKKHQEEILVTDLVEEALAHQFCRYMRKFYYGEGNEIFTDLQNILCRKEDEMIALVEYLFKRKITCEYHDIMKDIFLLKAKDACHNPSPNKLANHISDFAAMFLLKYGYQFLEFKAQIRKKWTDWDEFEKFLNASSFSEVEKFMMACFQKYPLKTFLPLSNWANSFINIIDKLPVSITICDASSLSPGFPMLYCNHKFELLTGYPKSFALGKNCKFLQFPDGDMNIARKLRLGHDPGCLLKKKPLSLLDKIRKEGFERMKFIEPFAELKFNSLYDTKPKETDDMGEHSDDEQEYVNAAMRAALTAGKACDVMLCNYKKDGTAFINFVALRPLFSATGEYCFVLGLHYDVTSILTKAKKVLGGDRVADSTEQQAQVEPVEGVTALEPQTDVHTVEEKEVPVSYSTTEIPLSARSMSSCNMSQDSHEQHASGDDASVDSHMSGHSIENKGAEKVIQKPAGKKKPRKTKLKKTKSMLHTEKANIMKLLMILRVLAPLIPQLLPGTASTELRQLLSAKMK